MKPLSFNEIAALTIAMLAMAFAVFGPRVLG